MNWIKNYNFECLTINTISSDFEKNIMDCNKKITTEFGGNLNARIEKCLKFEKLSNYPALFNMSERISKKRV